MSGRLLIVCPYSVHIAKARVSANICFYNLKAILKSNYFRDGQDTAKRDFSLTKTMKFTLPKNGAQTREIIIKYGLPKSDASYFNIDLSHVGTSKEEYKEKIKSKISKQMYYRDLKID